jgi:CheY-like chemotaxis protein
MGDRAVVLTDEERGERAVCASEVPDEDRIGFPESRAVVLVADDDDALRRTLAEILSLHGHTVIQANDGDQALNLLRSHQVSVLVLDLAMPRVDGVSVLKALDASRPKVIVYSAFDYYSIDHLDKIGLGPRVSRVLHKPAPPRQLVEAVLDALTG